MDPTPILRLLASRRLAKLDRMDPAATQQRTLLALVEAARRTNFGQEHGFDEIHSVADYQARVPLRSFEDFWADYWKAAWPVLDRVTWPGRIPFFARTSGTTTGRTKFIPITKQIIKGNERAGFDLMCFHLAQRPESRPLSGKSFIVAGSAALEEVSPGVFSGDVSGINTKLMPSWVSRRILPAGEHALISNWDEKVQVLSRQALEHRITMVSGMCNWLLAMLDAIRQRRREAGLGDGPTLPDLQLMIHSGVPMDLYSERLGAHLEGTAVETRELYAASEGFIACADRGPGEGLRMMLDNELFMEFVPIEELGSDNPRRFWAADVERGVDYAIALTNNAGLWSYLLGDVVRFVDTRPLRMLVLGRTSQMLSPFGEHLIAAEIDAAVRAAAQGLGIGFAEYTVGPVLPERLGARGYHVYVIEPSAPLEGEPQALARAAAQRIDRVLCEKNEDYQAQRRGDQGVAPPRVAWAEPGTFQSWMRAKNKLGGQHKVPRVTAKPDRFAALADELGLDLQPTSREAGDARLEQAV